MIKKGHIYKQGKGVNQKTSERLVVLTAEYFRWYHDEAELRSGKFLGSIPLQYVYNCVASRMAAGEHPAISIGATLWISKEGKEEGKRDFFFGCKD